MFYVSVLLSIALLVIANLAVRRSERPFPIVLIAGLGIAIAPQIVLCFFPAVMIQTVLIVLCVVAWRYLEMEDLRQFLVLSCASTVLAYLVIGASAWYSVRSLRGQFGHTSLADRIPEWPARPEAALPAAAADRLSVFENRVDFLDVADPKDALRLEQLEELTERPFGAFLRRPAFGVWMYGSMSEATLRYGLRADAPLQQTGPPMRCTWSAGALQKEPADNDRMRAALLDMHQTCSADFVNRKGFGLFRDHEHVAGFQEHRISRIPAPEPPWLLVRVDLVGLARHGVWETDGLQGAAVAYVSGHLPRMDELRTAETRPPDDFETEGLKALRDGQDLFIRDAAEGRRMLGSIRNARQCTACHGGNRGDLLGAMSYTLAKRVH